VKRTLIFLAIISTLAVGLPSRGVLSRITGGALSGYVRNQTSEPVAGAKITAINSAANLDRLKFTY